MKGQAVATVSRGRVFEHLGHGFELPSRFREKSFNGLLQMTEPVNDAFPHGKARTLKRPREGGEILG